MNLSLSDFRVRLALNPGFIRGLMKKRLDILIFANTSPALHKETSLHCMHVGAICWCSTQC